MVVLGQSGPRGTSRFPPSLRRSTASKGRFLNPLVVSEMAQLSHQYTSITRGRASPPRGSGIASQSRNQSFLASAGCGVPTAPRAGSARGSCASRAGSTPDPLAAGASAICTGSARGSHAAGAGSCGVSPCRRGGGWRGG